MKILLIEPYYGGSHRAWADGLARHSKHTVTLLTLPAEFWKWRMQGGAVSLARLFNELDSKDFDLILASDMFDLSTFVALTRIKIPTLLYMHENQLVYPQNQRQNHGWRYGFINYTSALVADAVCFNSQYHMDAFFTELPRMLKHFPDYNELDTIAEIKAKSSVLSLGIDLQRFDVHEKQYRNDIPIILWNHRWEADKNPQPFFDALYQLDADNIPFNLILTGENFRQNPKEFLQAQSYFGEQILSYGYLPTFAEYANALWQSDIVVSTAHHDFFGIAITEAIYCNCLPILPNRLNYPALVPETHQSQLLYDTSSPYELLKQILTESPKIDQSDLKTKVAQFDWATQIHQYDSFFEKMLG